MKRYPKQILSVLLLLATLLGVMWVLLLRHHHAPEKEGPIPSKPAASNSIDTGELAPKAAAQSGLENGEPARPAGVEAEGWAYLLRVRRLLLAANQPIEFYARIVDQENQPIADALVKLSLSRVDENLVRARFPNLKMGDEIVVDSIQLRSDARGWVRLTGRTGKSLAVESVEKDGYLWSSPRIGSFLYEAGGRRVGYVGMEAAFDSSKGYVFHLWRKGDVEPTVPVSIRVNMDQVSSGGWISNYFVNLISGKWGTDPVEHTDLGIHGVRHLTGLKERPYEFTITLSVPHGGIVVSGDYYPYRAPRDGYRNSWTFLNKPMTGSLEDGPWTKTMYMKLRGGRAYAGFRVTFQKTGFDLAFDGVVNPAGSTNLEPDPAKQITDPEEIRRLDEETARGLKP